MIEKLDQIPDKPFWTFAQCLRLEKQARAREERLQQQGKLKEFANPYDQIRIAEAMRESKSTLNNLEQGDHELDPRKPSNVEKNHQRRLKYLLAIGVPQQEFIERFNDHQNEQGDSLLTVGFSHFLLASPVVLLAQRNQDIPFRFSSQSSDAKLHFLNTDKPGKKLAPNYSEDWLEHINKKHIDMLISTDRDIADFRDVVKVAEISSNNRSKVCCLYDQKKHKDLVNWEGHLFDNPSIDKGDIWAEHYRYSKFFRFLKYFKLEVPVRNQADPPIKLYCRPFKFVCEDAKNFTDHWKRVFDINFFYPEQSDDEIATQIVREGTLHDGSAFCAYLGFEPHCSRIYEKVRKLCEKQQQDERGKLLPPIDVGRCEAKTSAFFEDRKHPKSTLVLYVREKVAENSPKEIDELLRLFQQAVGLIKDDLAIPKPEKSGSVRNISRYFGIDPKLTVRELNGIIHDFKIGYHQDYISFITRSKTT